MYTDIKTEGRAIPWNKGKLLGQKPPLKLKEIWAIRIRLQLTHRSRELALFNLAIDIESLQQLRSGVMPWSSLARRLRSSRARGRSSLAAPRKDPAPRPRRSLRHRRERG
jgi:hypothetical protein